MSRPLLLEAYCGAHVRAIVGGGACGQWRPVAHKVWIRWPMGDVLETTGSSPLRLDAEGGETAQLLK